MSEQFHIFLTKNLGAYGDAGGIITNNEELSKRIKMIANHGQKGSMNII